MKNDARTNTENSDLVQLLSKDDAEKEFGEAIASLIQTDSTVTWAKFILTDDKPNGNKQRVPFEEFENILKTGSFKPIKMAMGRINDSHDDAQPLGVITNLKVEGNKIVALAALWNKEREDDIALIKDRVNSNKPVNVSFELLYESAINNDGVYDLRDVELRAVTIVGVPAYMGRTQMLAVAAKDVKWTNTYIEKLPDSSFLHIEKDGTRYFPYRDETGKIDTGRFADILDEIAQSPLSQNTQKSIRHQVNKMNSVIQADAALVELLMEEDVNTEDNTLDIKELEGKVTELTSGLAIASQQLTEAKAELEAIAEERDLAKNKVGELEAELQPLRDFKAEADEALAKAEKLDAVKTKFKDAGLEKSEDYFKDNEEKLLALDENGLDFMVQELVAFRSEEGGESSASLGKNSGVPNVPGTKSGNSDISDIVKALRSRNAK